MSNADEQAVKDYNLIANQHRNLVKIADSPLPKHKAKKFEQLVTDSNVRLFNARQKATKAMERLIKKGVKV